MKTSPRGAAKRPSVGVMVGHQAAVYKNFLHTSKGYFSNMERLSLISQPRQTAEMNVWRVSSPK